MNASLLDLYVDYLISSFGATTARGLSNLLNGELSHDKISRLRASPAQTSANLWLLVKPLVRQVESEDGVLIIDDSISHSPYARCINTSSFVPSGAAAESCVCSEIPLEFQRTGASA